MAVLLEVPPQLVDRLDLAAAVKAEAESSRTLLPSRVVEETLGGHADDYARAIAARLVVGLDVEPQETVWVPKPGNVGRYRPLVALPIQERVLFRALTSDLGEDAPAPDRSSEMFATFQSAPVEARHEYIVVGDVASFYFYVDHETLEMRLIDSTARADTAEAIRGLLSGLQNRPYGLPQNFPPSDVLAEVYISWVQRRLIRADVATYRHNDDFRLGAQDWGTALQALELLQEELSSIGLDLNGEKTWIMRRENYQANLGLSERLFQEAIADIDHDGNGDEGQEFGKVDPYTGEPIEPEIAGDLLSDDEILAMSDALFRTAAEQRLSQDERLTGFQLRANRELVTSSLLHFRRLRSPLALDLGPSLVAVDPSFAPLYSLYLGALAADDQAEETSERVLAVLEKFRGHGPYWAQSWLMDPLLSPDAGLSNAAEDWLATFMRSRAPGVLQARAALVLARHRKLDIADLLLLFDRLPVAAKPDVVAALAFRVGALNDQIRAVTESAYLYRWVFDHAIANAGDCRWA